MPKTQSRGWYRAATWLFVSSLFSIPFAVSADVQPLPSNPLTPINAWGYALNPNVAPTYSSSGGTPSAAPSASPSGGIAPSGLTGVDDGTYSFERENAGLGRLTDPTLGSNTGAFQYEIKIKVPPGRNGLTPDLRLSYSSQDKTANSPFGYGWRISIPYIERLNKYGLDNLYGTTSPAFYSSLSGELATTSTSTQFYTRDDDGSFLNYVFNNNSWTVTDKAGKTYLFGTSTAGQMTDPNNASTTYMWMLQQVTDANGNTINYQYSKDSGQIYPLAIEYAGTASSSPPFEVDFSKSLFATSTATSTATGFPVRTKYKIDQISAQVNGKVVHTYALAYGMGDNTGRQLLTSVTESGKPENGAATTTLPAILFTYSKSQTTWATSTWTQPIYNAITGQQWDRGVNLVDVNGDGLADEVQAFQQYNSGTGGYDNYLAVYINATSTGWKLDTGWQVPCPATQINSSNNLLDGGGRILDVNGDNLPDFVCWSNVYLNTGHTWVLASTTLPVPVADASRYDFGVRFGDVNGDGLVDVVQSYDNIDGITGFHTYTQNVYLNNGSGWATTTQWTLATTTVFANSNHTSDNISDLIDVNGDGLADLVQGNNVYINTGNGWVLDPSWQLPLTDGTMATRFFDVNGDGLVDMVMADGYVGPYPAPDVYHWNNNLVYLNTGSGWVKDNSRVMPVPVQESTMDTGTRFADINGDGIADIVVDGWGQMQNDYAWSQNNQYLSQGDQPDLLKTVTEALGGKSTVTYQGSPQYLDANGQMLNASLPVNLMTVKQIDKYDAIGATTTDSYIYSNGRMYFGGPFDRKLAGFGLISKTDALGDVFKNYFHQGDTSLLPGINFQNATSSYGRFYGSPMTFTAPSCTGPNSYVIGVFRGNGITSITYGSSTLTNFMTVDAPYYNLRDPISFWGLPNPPPGSQPVTVTSNYPGDALAAVEACYTGVKQTGQPEATSSVDVYSANHIYARLTPLTPTAMVIGSLVSQNNQGDIGQNGGTTRYQVTAGNLIDTNGPVDPVTQVTFDDGLSSEDGAGIMMSLLTADTSTGFGKYNDNESKIGKIYRSEVYDSNGNLYRLNINKWDSVSRGGNASFVKMTENSQEDFDGNADHKDHAQTFDYDNSTGNLSQLVDWGVVTASTTSSNFADTGYDKITKSYAYATSSLSSVVAPYDEALFDINSNKLSETRHYYDGLALGSSTIGNETKTDFWESGGSYASTTKAYNALGLVASSTDALGHITSYLYDALNLYPATTTNAVGQNTVMAYDYSSGKTATTTDANGNIWVNVFDGLDRLITLKEPDPSVASTTVVKSSFTYATTTPFTVHEIDNLNSATSTDLYSYFDGFNRLIETKKEANNGNWIEQDTAYNPVGQVGTTSLPYFVATSTYATATSTNSLFVTTLYDPLMRPKSVTNAVGTTQYAYDNWTTDITDPKGVHKKLTNDAFGRLIEVDEHNSTSTYVTTYSYDGLGDLTSVADAGNNFRNFTYDGLGRRLSAEDLHPSGDTTYGTTSYTYDDASNLIQTVNPRNQIVNYTYDALNRVLTEDYTAATGTEVTYTYDTCGAGKGYLCVASTTVSKYTYTYNPDNLLKTESDFITGGSTYGTTYLYDRLGNYTSITYPDSASVIYHYNSAGQLDQVQEKENGGTYANVVSGLDYSPTGQLTTLTYGNGVTQTNTYDPTALYRLSNRVSILPTSSHAQDLTYTYDALGNITRIVDASNSKTAKTLDFTYDDLSRLLTASTTNATTSPDYLQTFTYDPLGNITSGPKGMYQYSNNPNSPYANPDAVTNINAVGVGTTTLSYDQSGNLLTDGTWHYTWDYKNELTQATSTGITDTYGYNHTGARVKLVEGSVTRLFPDKFYAPYRGGAATTTKYVYAGDLLLEEIDKVGATSTPHYILTDNLLGTSVVTDASGAIQETEDYYPYGQIRFDSTSGGYGGEKRKYVDQFYDSSTGLNYMNARYQNGGVGTFISEDPVAWGDAKQQSLTNPQSLNIYSYAGDNPISKSDPSGLCIEDACAVEVLGTEAVITAAPRIATIVGPVIAGTISAGMNYAGQVLNNQSSGVKNPYSSNISNTQLVTSFGGGVLTEGLGVESAVGSGLYAAGQSALGDVQSGKPINLGQALASGVSTALSVGTLHGLLPKVSVPAISTPLQKIRYSTVQNTLSGSVSTIVTSKLNQNSNQQKNIKSQN